MKRRKRSGYTVASGVVARCLKRYPMRDRWGDVSVRDYMEWAALRAYAIGVRDGKAKAKGGVR